MIFETNPKCLPETYYLPYGLTSEYLPQEKNPLISSSHRSLQFLPHAAPSAWTTSLKLFYCPITNYPYKHLHYPQGTEFPSLYAQQEIKPKSKQKQWPFPTVMCEILSRG